MKTLVVIPARFASTRLPAKMLLRESGKFLIQHVWERVKLAHGAHETLIATDDDRIIEAARSFGATAIMTSPHCRSGTDRVAEVVRGRGDVDLVVNVQGDEPCLDPDALSALIARMTPSAAHAVAPRMGTLAAPWPRDIDVASPNAVKVVWDHAGDALYFSRSPIPYYRDAATQPTTAADSPPKHWLHVGVYAYQRQTLLDLATWPPSPLEIAESLEQLRALQHGVKLAVVPVRHASFGIDVRADYDRFLARLAAGECSSFRA